jgi:hypothetical protein
MAGRSGVRRFDGVRAMRESTIRESKIGESKIMESKIIE